MEQQRVIQHGKSFSNSNSYKNLNRNCDVTYPSQPSDNTPEISLDESNIETNAPTGTRGRVEQCHYHTKHQPHFFFCPSHNNNHHNKNYHKPMMNNSCYQQHTFMMDSLSLESTQSEFGRPIQQQSCCCKPKKSKRGISPAPSSCCCKSQKRPPEQNTLQCCKSKNHKQSGYEPAFCQSQQKKPDVCPEQKYTCRCTRPALQEITCEKSKSNVDLGGVEKKPKEEKSGCKDQVSEACALEQQVVKIVKQYLECHPDICQCKNCLEALKALAKETLCSVQKPERSQSNKNHPEDCCCLQCLVERRECMKKQLEKFILREEHNNEESYKEEIVRVCQEIKRLREIKRQLESLQSERGESSNCTRESSRTDQSYPSGVSTTEVSELEPSASAVEQQPENLLSAGLQDCNDGQQRKHDLVNCDCDFCKKAREMIFQLREKNHDVANCCCDHCQVARKMLMESG